MKCTIFDLDGTILYTLEDLYIATNYALEICGYKTRNIEQIKSFVGNGVAKLIERAIGEDCAPEEKQKCLHIFKNYYSKNAQNNTKPYKGIIEVFQYLQNKNVKIAVNSNKYNIAVKKLCKKYFSTYISYAIGESDNCPKKPDPTGVNIILKHLGCNKENAVYIGDSLVDIQTAKNAKIPCISVSWGYCNRNILYENNNYIADNTTSLIDKINYILNL